MHTRRFRRRAPSGTMWRRFCFLFCLGLLAGLCSASSVWAQAPSISNWYGQRGAVARSSTRFPSHGDITEYSYEKIPAWPSAAWQRITKPRIDWFVRSRLCGNPYRCRYDVDFWYYTNQVWIPSNFNVTNFQIRVSRVDDGLRVRIYNSRHPAGVVPPNAYIKLGGGTLLTGNMSSYIVKGEINRILVTAVDDCCSGFGFGSIDVMLNGVAISTVNNPPSITRVPGATATQGVVYSTTTVTSTDPDPGDRVSYKLVSSPSGATINPTTGKVSWTPGPGDANKTFKFTVEACDSRGLCVRRTWTVRVIDVNDPPVITRTPSGNATESQPYVFLPGVTDPDPRDTHKWNLVSGPPGATIDPTTGRVNWTPRPQDAGKTFTFTMRVCDSGTPALCANKTWRVTVKNVNNPPKIVGNPPTVATENQTYRFDLNETDADPGDKHSWNLDSGPPGATIDPTTGVVNWRPGPNDSGKTFTFKVTVCDDGSPKACDTKTWRVTVRDVNNPPAIIGTAPTTGTEGQVYNFKPGVQDADPGDVHRWVLVSGPPGATVNPTTGEVNWTPRPQDAGKTFTFTMRVCDNGTPALCANKTFRVTVKNVNNPPVIVGNPPTTATEDKPYRFDLDETDLDPGDTHTWKLKAGPPGATINPTTGEINWTPKDADAGKSFTFSTEVCDNGQPQLCTTKTWKVFVQNTEDPPVITSTPPTAVPQGNVYTYSPTAVDPDPNDTLTWTGTKLPPGAKIDPQTGKITWTPGPGDGGKTYDVEIKVCDQTGKCDTQKFQIKVINKNDPPKITSTPVTSATEKKPYTYTPAATDPDLPDDTLTWKGVKLPPGAKIDPQTGKITWTPGAGDASKTYDVEIQVCDKAGACDTQTFKLKVGNVNDPPKITGTPPTVSYVGEETTFTPQGTDPDPGDVLTWKFKKAPPGATIDPKTGVVKWKPAPGDADKEVTFVLELCDDGQPKLCDTKTFKLTPRTKCVVDADCAKDLICVQQATVRICIAEGCSTQSPKCSKQGDFCTDGSCTADPCTNKTCPTGTTCRSTDGKCIKSCAGVTCPAGSFCDGGTCVNDPCKDNPCQQGEVCNTSDPNQPVCIKDPCSNSACKHGRVCYLDRCIDDPCDGLVCPDKAQRCVAGQCVERQPCAVDVNCPTDQVCIGKRCYEPGCYTQNPQCKGQDQLCLSTNCEDDKCAKGLTCGNDEFCRPSDGVCVKACAAVTCATGQKCEDGKCINDPCSSVTCAAGKVCVDGKCDKDNCAASNVCKSGRVCNPNVNECTDDPCFRVTCPDPKQVCSFGQCLPPAQCQFDVDCPSKGLCIKGKCVTPTCGPNKACPAGKICLDGTCLDDSCNGKKCNDNQFCKAGTCVDTCAGVFCKQEEICVNGKCTNEPCAGKQCAQGEVCENGKCVKDECKPNVCRDGRVCKLDQCEADACYGIQCPTGQKCEKGQCVGDLPCTHDSQCPGDGVCVEKTCRPSNCYPNPCSDGKICLKGKCVENPCANKQCAQDEFCSPTMEGKCVPVCPTCADGEICQEGSCQPDPCANTQCQEGQSCEKGQCVANPCTAKDARLCRYQRACTKEGCFDDGCANVACAAGQVCRNGFCYAPKVVEEPTDPEGEGGEREGELVFDEGPTDDAGLFDDGSSDEDPGDDGPSDDVEPDDGTNDEEPGGDAVDYPDVIASGGCGCNAANAATPSLVLLFLGLLAFVRRQRRRL